MRLFRSLVLASALTGLVFSSVTSAVAQEHGEYHHEHDDAGTAVVAGILGIIVGAAIAGGKNGQRYEQPNYAPPQQPYYAQPPQPQYYTQQGPQTLCVLAYNAYTRQVTREYITFQFGDESWRNYRPC